MICPKCNSNVKDGMKFCPKCGNRFELTQPLRCPKCNIVVEEETNFCPECGSPIKIPIQKKCSSCGAELEEGENFCTYCGTPIAEQVSIPQTPNPILHNQNCQGSVLNLKWKGCEWLPTIFTYSISVIVDGKQYDGFKGRESSELFIPVSSSKMKIQLKYQGIATEFELNLVPNQNYICTLQYSGDFPASGIIAYELKDEKNCIVVSDGNVSIGAQLLLFVIPLVGYIYYFMKKEKEPICAKVGLILALFGTAVSIFLFMVR